MLNSHAKNGLSLIILIGGGFVNSGFIGQAQAQTPGTMLGLSQDVNGTLTVNSVNPGGCPTRICTTNLVTSIDCHTNYQRIRVCTTNATTGIVSCTNTLVPSVRCRTNTFTHIDCTNVFLTPTTVAIQEALSGAITAGTNGCDELSGFGLFPSNAVFNAVIYAQLRTNDWRGSHSGSFKILDGTNVIASGSLTGVNAACRPCNHIEGTLSGLVKGSGALAGARIKASYMGNLTAVSCPSPNVPQGVIQLEIDGVVVTRCPSLAGRRDDDGGHDGGHGGGHDGGQQGGD